MLEFLASEMGFTIFSIEANMPEAYRLNDYVLNGTGDPAQLLRGMYFWTWDTEEVLDMIRWMREFNKSGKGRVQFTGFDMQTPTSRRASCATFTSRRTTRRSCPTCDEATKMSDDAPTRAPAAAFGVATGSFPVSRAAGKKVRYSGYIKTEGVTRGYRRTLVACRRPVRRAGVRQHAEPRSDRNDRLDAGTRSSCQWTRAQRTSTSGRCCRVMAPPGSMT